MSASDIDGAGCWTFSSRRSIGIFHVSVIMLLVSACTPDAQSCDDWNTPSFFSNASESDLEHCLEIGNISDLDQWNNGPIHASMADTTGRSFSRLVERGADPNQRGFLGSTPLMYAVEFAWRAETIKRAIEGGADPGVADEKGDTALIKALEVGHDRQVIGLLEAGAPASMSNVEGATPLYIAVDHGRPEMVPHLLECGANPDGDPRRNPLHAAVEAAAIDTASLLLAAGANADGGYDVPLVLAAREGNAALLKLLVGAGASVNQPDWTDQTPLEAASHANLDEVIQWLLERGAIVRSGVRMTALHWLMHNGRPDASAVERLLMSGADPRAADRSGNSPLHYVAGVKEPAIVRHLLHAGADPLASNQAGVTPLHLAAAGTSQGVLELLLAATRSVNPLDFRGRTPLHYAAVADRPLTIIETLLRGGVLPTVRDYGDMTAHELAKYWSSDPAVVQRLANAR